MSEVKNEIATYFGRCKCCLSYGYLKNMWTEHQFEGESEVYGEMLVDCFALTWDSSESIDQDQICEQCVNRLRDACDFKKIVLTSQEDFYRQLGDGDDKDTIPKLEDCDEEYLMVYKEADSDTADTADTDTADMDVSVNDASACDEEYEDVEYLEDEVGGDAKEALVATSSTQAQKPKRRRKADTPTDSDDGVKRKWPKRLPKNERFKTYKQYTEENLRQCLEAVRSGEITPNDAARKYNIPKKTICAKMRLEPTDALGTKNTTETSLHQLQNNERTILKKYKDNVRLIITNSNATPIKGRWGIGYGCLYCEYHTQIPAELKEHTTKIHKNDTGKNKVKSVADMIIKLDITDLKCKLCAKEINNLQDFMQHLHLIHKLPINFDINNHIVPFKFKTEQLLCALCDKPFSHFKHLTEHMTDHYPNYKCDECSRQFINLRSQKIHSFRHRIGTFKCMHCPKIFNTRIKVKEHERVIHQNGSKTRKCGYCDEKFMDSVQRTNHEVKVHGIQMPKFECKACGKSFDSQRSLNNHVNHFHLLLRPHICPECGKGFYKKNELKRHSVKHTGLREFQCKVCFKWYGSKRSLTAHSKLHEDRIVLACEYCPKTFKNKNGLVHHIRSQHGNIY
ncbi:zinc finger protein 551-like isoform X2 [Trichoplusia ni]|uniref:Zinc finger protein 551-like isoform X2 n=1 Tax=Trichoplusia ni TaxID=7111 RepID=A0A7E5WTT8_TRINI|nr:zinc finger protein 551-like isoform X2 [Trichoplusia ni]